jgi:hypothetical protein
MSWFGCRGVAVAIVACFGPALSAQDFKLELRVTAKSPRVGVPLAMEARLTNLTSRPLPAMASCDPWESGLPEALSLEARGPDDKSVRIVPRATYFAEHPQPAPRVEQVAPGQAWDPFASASLVAHSMRHFAPLVPGKHRIRAVYDTAQYSPARRPANVPAVRVASAWIEIDVQPGDPIPAWDEANWGPDLIRQVAEQLLVEEYFVARWAQRDGISNRDHKIALAINSIRAMTGEGGSLSDTPQGVDSAKDAKRFLAAQGAAPVPALIRALSIPPDGTYDWTTARADWIDLLAAAGDRRAVVPLVEQVISLRADQASAYQDNRPSMALAQLGDPDVLPLLLETYPFENPAVQIAIGAIVNWTHSDIESQLGPQALQIWRQLRSEQEAEGQRIGRPVDLQRGHPIRFRGANAPLRALLGPRGVRVRNDFLNPTEHEGLRLEVKVNPAFVEIGEQFSFDMRIVNNSPKTVTLMRSRDGSDVGWVMPTIGVEIRGPDHRQLHTGLGGRCGNVNALHPPRDLVTLRPGESFDPFSQGAFSHAALTYFRQKSLGMYRIKLYYSTVGQARGGLGDAGQRPAEVAPVKLASNAAELEVVSTEESARRLGGKPRRFPDRQAAEWALGLGGTVTVLSTAYPESFSDLSKLPASPFTLVGINLAGKSNVSDAALATLGGLSGLQTLDLSRTNISDSALPVLQSLTGLRRLNLGHTRVTAARLAPQTSPRYGWSTCLNLPTSICTKPRPSPLS